MKIFKLRLLNTLVFITFLLLGCSKDNNNPIDDTTNTTLKGSDFMSLSSGNVIAAKVSGTSTEYDSSGNITGSTSINNEDFSGTIGATTTVRNITVNPLYGNDNGLTKLIGYLYISNNEVLGFDKSSNSLASVLLPAELSVGKEWIANPQSPTNQQVKLKLVEFLNSFTNSVGKTFQNVIKVDETYNYSYTSTDYQESLKVLSTIYFAKGKGIVEVSLNDYEEIYKYDYTIWKLYKKTKATGKASLNN